MTQSAGFFLLYRAQSLEEYGLGKVETTHNPIVKSQSLVLWLNDHDDDRLLSPPRSVVPVSNRVRRDDRSISGALLS